VEAPDPVFRRLFNLYIEGFGSRCREELPPDRIELTTQVRVSSTDHSVKNGLGIETCTGFTCHEWAKRKQGVFADARQYAALVKLGELATAKPASRAYNPPPRDLAAAFAPSQMAKATEQDMAQLFQLNACATPGLKRLGENLLRFATGSAPIVLSDADALPEAALAARLIGSSAEDPDFKRLLDDLVASDSKKWVMNKFMPGSLSNVVITARDAAGQPARVTGRYFFNLKPAVGWI